MDTQAQKPAQVRRARNRRGEGGKLRGDILRGATRILEESGEEAVTLRAVAREVGIAAPSIYAHFGNREEIVAAVISEAFGELITALTARAIEDRPDPVDRLLAGCAAYLDFAVEHPQRYRVLFENRRPPDLEAHVAVDQMIGFEAFSVLVNRIADCAAAGRSRSESPFGDATAVWVALHGYATLHAAVPNFPWPERAALANRIVLELAKVEPVKTPTSTTQ